MLKTRRKFYLGCVLAAGQFTSVSGWAVVPAGHEVMPVHVGVSAVHEVMPETRPGATNAVVSQASAAERGVHPTEASVARLGVDSAARLGADSAAHPAGVDSTAHLSVDGAARLSVDSTAHPGVDSAARLSVDNTAHLSVDGAARLSVDSTAHPGVDSAARLSADSLRSSQENRASSNPLSSLPVRPAGAALGDVSRPAGPGDSAYLPAQAAVTSGSRAVTVVDTLPAHTSVARQDAVPGRGAAMPHEVAASAATKRSAPGGDVSQTDGPPAKQARTSAPGMEAAGQQRRPVSAAVVQAYQDARQGDPDLTVAVFAQRQNVSYGALSGLVKNDGTLKVRGQQMLDRENGQRPGQVTADVVRAYQDARAGDPNLTVAVFAQRQNVSYNALSGLVKNDGSLKVRGQQMLARENGQAPGQVTADVVRAYQDARAGDPALTVQSFAQRQNVSAGSLQSYVQNDGTLRVKGQQMLARENGQAPGEVTADVVRAYQNARAGDPALTTAVFAQQQNVSAAALESYVQNSGAPTYRGQRKLEMEGLQEAPTPGNRSRPPSPADADLLTLPLSPNTAHQLRRELSPDTSSGAAGVTAGR